MTTGIVAGNIFGHFMVNATLDPASVAANTTAEQTFTVPNLQLRDQVQVTKPTLSAGLGIVNARVSAANTLAITFSNNTASPIDAGSEVYSLLVFRPESNVRTVV